MQKQTEKYYCRVLSLFYFINGVSKSKVGKESKAQSAKFTNVLSKRTTNSNRNSCLALATYEGGNAEKICIILCKSMKFCPVPFCKPLWECRVAPFWLSVCLSVCLYSHAACLSLGLPASLAVCLLFLSYLSEVFSACSTTYRAGKLSPLIG